MGLSQQEISDLLKKRYEHGYDTGEHYARRKLRPLIIAALKAKRLATHREPQIYEILCKALDICGDYISTQMLKHSKE
jgi:hypothetical protein